MSRITLSDLLDVGTITEQEIKLLIDITLDNWQGRRIITKNKSHVRDGEDFYNEHLQRRFVETVNLFFERIEEETGVPFLYHINADHFSIDDINRIHNKAKKRVRNIKKLNDHLRKAFPDNTNMQKATYWFKL